MCRIQMSLETALGRGRFWVAFDCNSFVRIGPKSTELTDLIRSDILIGVRQMGLDNVDVRTCLCGRLWTCLNLVLSWYDWCFRSNWKIASGSDISQLKSEKDSWHQTLLSNLIGSNSRPNFISQFSAAQFALACKPKKSNEQGCADTS